METYVISQKGPQLRLLVTVILSVFMFSIDYSMVNVSLPTLAKYFSANIGTVAQLPVAYILVVTSALLGFGKLGDIRGFKKVFIAGLGVFLAGTCLCSVSGNINMLIGARMLQGLGEAMFSPVGLAIATTYLPSEKKGLALGAIALTQGLGLALGNALGGFINAHLIWRVIFLVNIPILILTAILAFRAIPAQQHRAEDKRFDTTGSALIFICLATLLYALNAMGRMSWNRTMVFACLAVSAVSFGLFLIQEKKIAYPILDFKLFKNKDFTFASLSTVFMLFVFMGFNFLAPFYLELVMKIPVMKVGILLVVPSLMMLILAPVAGRLSDRIGSRALTVTGSLIAVVSCVMFMFINQDSPILIVALTLLVLGSAAGIFLAPNNRLVMTQAPGDRQGVASGVYKISLSFGSVLGMAVFPIIIMKAALGHAKFNHMAASLIRSSPETVLFGFRHAFAAGIIIAAASAVFAFLARDKR